MDEDTEYSSSFEGEDEDVHLKEETVNNKSSDRCINTAKVSIESTLSKKIDDLCLKRKSKQVEPDKSWVLNKSFNKFNNIKQDENHGKIRKGDQYGDNGPTQNLFESLYYTKRSSSCFKGSAAINRKKKLREIERDNLVCIKINMKNWSFKFKYVITNRFF